MQWLYILALTLPPILLLYTALMRTLPNYSESLILNSVYGEITILRSPKAVPEIKASCLEDLYFATLSENRRARAKA